MDELRTTNRLLCGMLVLMALATAYFAKDIILPVVLGLMLALTLGPTVRACSRVGCPPPVAAVLIIFSLFGIIAAAVYFFSGAVTIWFDEIPVIMAELRGKLRAIIESFEHVRQASEQVEEMVVSAEEGGEPRAVVVDQPGLLTTAVSTFASFTTSLAVGMVLAVFLLGSGGLPQAGTAAVGRRSRGQPTDASAIIMVIERSMSHYLFTITLINAGLGLSIGIAMYLVGMPYAPAWAVAGFFLNFLPYVGGLIGTFGVAAFSIVTFESLSYAFLAPALYQLLTTLEAQFVTPVLLGMRLRLNAVSVFLAVIFWSWLWGIPGALLAVPILVMIKVISDEVEGLAWLSRLLSGPPVEETEKKADA
ncbi:AI-2E family transporter [Amaricoccus tamworthensis]|uniref:AI-2E family transporter n=1 Tax=Amaricoccus tamworthensis TaxID=57002 RepID=UPI003C7C44E8